MQTLVKMDELPQAVRDFVGYKLTVQGRSKKTMDEYALDLRTFFRWLTKKRSGGDLSDGEKLREVDISGIGMDVIGSVTPAEIYDFLYYTLESRQNQSASRARKLSALKSFYKYLTVVVHLTDNDPTKNIDGPQKKKSLPKFLSLEESEALLDAVLADAESKTVARDYCIITLFLNCGMRLSELCGIDLSDIDRDMESLRVTGKGSKERLIYLNDACRDAARGQESRPGDKGSGRALSLVAPQPDLEQDGSVDSLQVPRRRRAREQVLFGAQAPSHSRDADVPHRKGRCARAQGYPRA